MSTTSSSSCWEAQEVGKGWMHAWKHPRARNPVFFWIKWLPWSLKKGLCLGVLEVVRLDRGKLTTKSAHECSESSMSMWTCKKKCARLLSASLICIWKGQKCHVWNTFGRKCARDCSKSSVFQVKILKPWRSESAFWGWPETLARARFTLENVKVHQTHIPKAKGFCRMFNVKFAAYVNHLRFLALLGFCPSQALPSEQVGRRADAWRNACWPPWLRSPDSSAQRVYQVDNNNFLASLDYSLAFDRANPALAIHARTKLGLLPNLASLFKSMCATNTGTCSSLVALT